MNRKGIKFGKHLMDTLTTGMYSEQLTIFREYIQNSTDGIDKAVIQGFLTGIDDSRIDITINSNDCTITIKDNGIGVPVNEAWSELINIGDSTKDIKSDRGFRGIGRLAGLSYADKVQFITSFSGEPEKTIITWDGTMLRKLIVPGQYKEHDLLSVVELVTKEQTIEEDPSLHYFEVRLIGVDKRYNKLLNIDEVHNYISQVAPVPFNAKKFPYYHDKQTGIKSYLSSLGVSLDEYNIYINNNPIPVYKPYKTDYENGKGQKDSILGIRYFSEFDNDNNLIFCGWHGESNFSGTVRDRQIAGLRLRKGNILIGDDRTLDDLFTQNRFNHWFIGEIYVFDLELIPNGRRDNFETNDFYWRFETLLRKHTSEMSRLPHWFSDANSLQRKVDQAQKQIEDIQTKVDGGLSSKIEKERLLQKKTDIESTLNKTEKKLENLQNKKPETKNDPLKNSIEKAKKLQKEIHKIEPKINTAQYKLDKDPRLSTYSKDIRKVIFKIFEVIDNELGKKAAESLEEKILNSIKPAKKRY